MKKGTVIPVLAGSLFALLSPGMAQAQTTVSPTQYVATVHGWVSYHAQAGLHSPIVGRLQLGQKALLVKKANPWWYEIAVNGKDVYITTNTSLIKVDTVAASASRSLSTYVETNHGWVDYHVQAKSSSAIGGRLLLGEKAPLIRKVNSWWYEILVNGKNVYITASTSLTHLVTSATGTGTTISNGSSSTVANNAPTTVSVQPGWQTSANKLIATAKTQLNVPYLWGKQEPGIGFDCSNFVAWSFKTALNDAFSGSSVYQRYHVGTPVALSQIREGDLLFFKTKNNATGSGHVGIYMGHGMVIQEGGGWGKVTIEPLQGTWLGRNLVFARRVIH